MAIPVDDAEIIIDATGVEVDHVSEDNITEGDLDLEIEMITDIVKEDKAGTMMIVEAGDFPRRSVKVTTVNKTGKIQEVENFNLWDF